MIGIAIGAAVFAILVVTACFLFFRQRKRQQAAPLDDPAAVEMEKARAQAAAAALGPSAGATPGRTRGESLVAIAAEQQRSPPQATPLQWQQTPAPPPSQQRQPPPFSPQPLLWGTPLRAEDVSVTSARPAEATWGAHDALPGTPVVRTPPRTLFASPQPEKRYAEASSAASAARRRAAGSAYAPTTEDWLDVVARAREGVERMQRLDEDLMRNLPQPPAARPGTRRFALMQQYLASPQVPAREIVAQQLALEEMPHASPPGSVTRAEELMTYSTAQGGHAAGTPAVTRSQALVAYDAWLQNEARRLDTAQRRRAASAAAAMGGASAGATPSTAGRPRGATWADSAAATPASAYRGAAGGAVPSSAAAPAMWGPPQGSAAGAALRVPPAYRTSASPPQAPGDSQYGTPQTPPNQRPNNWGP